MITSKRMLNGHHRIMRDGQPVGEAWRYPPRPPGCARRKGGKQFGMRLDGYLWSGEEPVPIGKGGGFTTTSTRTLWRALELARKVLEPGSTS